MRKKDKNVNFNGIHPAMFEAMFEADEVVRKILGYEMIITSCRDGQHSETSRHYIGCAWDIRTWTTPLSGEQISQGLRSLLVGTLQEVLGPDWNIYEHITHIHIGYKIRQT